MISVLNPSMSKIHRAFSGLVMTTGFLAASVLVAPAHAEVPYFEDAVASGSLPAMNDRLPEHPHVIDFAGRVRKSANMVGNLSPSWGGPKISVWRLSMAMPA